jgi:hypothetical protein
MGWGEVIGAGINAVAGIGRGRKNRKSAEKINQANVDAQLKMNADNIQHSVDMWNMTNAYNSPAQIMERYKQAGLNPHLIYGQQPQASQPMQASTSAPHMDQLPQTDTAFGEIAQAPFQMLQDYIANKKQQTEVNNMEKAKDVMDADITAKNAQTAETMQRNARSKFDLELAEELRTNTVENAILNTKNLGIQGDKIAQEIKNLDVQNKLSTAQIAKIAQDMSYTAQSIELLKIQGRNAEAENELKKAELKLRKEGLSFGDNVLLRIFNNGVNGIQDYWKDLGKGIKRNTQRLFQHDK